MVQCIHEAVWIVDIYHVRIAKMISVIIVFEFSQSFFYCPFIELCHLLNLRHEIIHHFLL